MNLKSISVQNLSPTLGAFAMRECITHHHACDCRERQFAHMAEENQRWRRRWMELRQSSRGTIINEDGDPLYVLIPLSVLNDQ